MDEDPLAVWAVATFNVAVLVAALVGALHLDGRLGDVLAGLNTWVGVALYCCLWATTWWTNGGWLAGLDGDDGLIGTLVAGGTWGGVNGVLFFWVLFFVAVIPTVGFDPTAVLFYLLALGIGTVLALGIGGIVGVLAAALDLALFRVADRLGPDVHAGTDGGGEREDSTETS